MERPQISAAEQAVQPKAREITAEIIHLNERWNAWQMPRAWRDIPDEERQRYEPLAEDARNQGIRPQIFDAYDDYDAEIAAKKTDLMLSCEALAEILSDLGGSGPRFLADTYICVDLPPDEVVAKLQKIRAGKLLSSDEYQLDAISHRDKRYPAMDIRKKDAALTNASVVVWKWDDDKYKLAGSTEPRRGLMFPTGEKEPRYKLDVHFGYNHPEAGRLVETVSLAIDKDIEGAFELTSEMYVERFTKHYRGVRDQYLKRLTEKDVAEFADFIAEIVGDTPESGIMRSKREVQEMVESLTNPAAHKAIHRFLDATNGAFYAHYELTRKREAAPTLIDQLNDPAMMAQAIAYIDSFILKYGKKLNQ